MPTDPDSVLIPLFKNTAIKNEGKSAAEGRPVYDDIEVVEIRGPGTRNYGVYPAHTLWPHWIIDPHTGEQHQITYAQRFAKQYAQFKQRAQQTKAGTPLEHAPFLTEGRRAELRAQNIYVLEQLAHVDGQELKNLGGGGREDKNRAIEFIAEAKQAAPNTTALHAELEAMKARAAILEEDNTALKRAVGSEGQFEDMSEDQLRGYIKTHSGHDPQGNLPRKVLVRMAVDLRPTKVA